MQNVFLSESDYFKVKAYADDDSQKLFIECNLKLPNWCSIIFLNPKENIKQKSKIILKALELETISHTDSIDEAKNIIAENEIHCIIISKSFSKEEIGNFEELFTTITIPKFIIDTDKSEENFLDDETTKQIQFKIIKFLYSEKKINDKKILNSLKEQLAKNINLERCHQDVLQDIASKLGNCECVKDRRIMKGIEPKNGKDGKLLLLVKKYTGKGEVLIDSHDVANYSNIRLFDNIRIGQKVARIYKAKKGTPGLDVFGKEIQAESGKDIEIKVDETLEIITSADNEFNIIIAKIDGYLEENNSNLKIQEELVINGNVDLHCGNVNFVGKVKITGDVLKGFSVKANRGIKILGSVEEAKISAPNGSITIDKYVYGGRNSYIFSEKNFICKIAHEINVEARGAIIIKKEALDSNFYTQSYILIKKSLLGGRLLSAKGVEIYEAGNELEKETKIYLANSVEATKEYGELLSNIDQHKKALELINAHLGPLAENPKLLNTLVETLRISMKSLLSKKDKVKQSLNSLKSKQEKMLEGANYPEEQKINFSKKVFKGVKVIYQEIEYKIDENTDGPISYKYDDEKKEIIENEYKLIEFNEEENE